jgi:eukaryotic-like serine/threonine-protein kinase
MVDPTDAHRRLTTALSDRYVIERELGAGGMATVYLAHDVKHDRPVALKVLRPELSAILGAGRFLAEIKTTANLQHPHILSLFDSGEADGLVFYVMPYVEGESLRDRLAREKQLPIEDAVRIAREVADALEYAHRHGVIHRDIKPENILLHGGHAQVADFGIALAASRSDGGTRMTETGMSLGTPHYMSPEQAMGEREITPKADLYALGCVLYEMLTAEPPFTGATAQAIIARVLTEEPRPLAPQRRTIPPHVEAATLKALAKLPADRFATAQEFADALGNPAFSAGATVATAAAVGAARRLPPRRLLEAALWVVAALAVALAGWVASRPRPSDVAPVVLRYAMQLPDSLAFEDGDGSSLAYAPDGSVFTYGSRSGLQLRSADRLDPVPVPGGRRGAGPFFSPDGQWLGFLTDGRLVKVPLAGGAPVTIVDSLVGYNFDWGADDTIRYHTILPTNQNSRVLMAVSARGGRPRLIARPDSGSDELFRMPTLLPDRRTVLFTIFKQSASRLAALDLKTGAITRFDQTGSTPRWVTQGFVVLGNSDGTLIALPFDTRRVRPTGPPVTIARGLFHPDAITVRAAISTSGAIVYVQSGVLAQRQLALVTRSGQATALTAESRGFGGPRFSPDGRRVAVDIVDETGGGPDVWTLDIAQRAWSRLTTDHISNRPVWTPDGRRIVYASNSDLWWVAADGSGRADSLLAAAGSRYPGAVTPDGRTVVFQDYGGTVNGIRALAFDSAPAARLVLAGTFNESAPALSPDGHWLAYQSDESGRLEVYVRPYPVSGGRVPVSVLGGTEPAWSRDGRELYYRSSDTMMVATVTLRPTFGVTARRNLFNSPFLRGTLLREYDVAPDGQRFVMVRGGTAPSTLIALHNVFDKLVYDRRRP